MRVAILKLGLDLIWVDHIKIIKFASLMADRLMIGLHSDTWVIKKRGFQVSSFKERQTILRAIKGVEDVVPFDDEIADTEDENLLEEVMAHYPFCQYVYVALQKFDMGLLRRHPTLEVIEYVRRIK